MSDAHEFRTKVIEAMEQADRVGCHMTAALLRAALALAAQPEPDDLRTVVTDLAHVDPGHFTAVGHLRDRARDALWAAADSATLEEGDSDV